MQITKAEHIFEVVDHYPLGYIIWNISNDEPKDYLPLCRLSTHQPFQGGRCVETNTLKALRCEGVDELLGAAGVGLNTPQKIIQFADRFAGTKHVGYELQRARTALPYAKMLMSRI